MVHVVWLKKDLRTTDHAPLAAAAEQGPAIALYVFEPEIFQSPEFDSAQCGFILESLREMRTALNRLGGKLVVRVGDMPTVLDEFHHRHPVTHLWSHRETGNHVSFQRDVRVAEWARGNGIGWTEFSQTGVIRRLKSRDGWADRWDRRMAEPLAPRIHRFCSPEDIAEGPLPTLEDLGLPETTKVSVQRGGEAAAVETLTSFLDRRGVNYRAGMSSPVTAWDECSRLSPYLTWGNLSIKQAYQAAVKQEKLLDEYHRAGGTVDRRWFGSLASFISRLHWHCHFMQKLEDEPRIEFENMCRAFDGLRETEFNRERFEAWCEGRTGFPMIDAAMRAVRRHGWINFRMRAMLVSFASYHLWLHWRPTAVFLARHFLDFEPGIHFCQFQMQSGTTGINTTRMYSPMKQVVDHDPTGAFIRRYVPELEGVPDEYLPEPHRMPPLLQLSVGCRIGKDYPLPIVDYKEASRHARDRIAAVLNRPETKREAEEILRRHGSRRPPSPAEEEAPPMSTSPGTRPRHRSRGRGSASEGAGSG